MNRRAFVTGAVLVAPLAAWAQQATRTPQVGVLDPSTEGADTMLKAYALRDAMRDFGWIDGRSVTLKLRFANRSEERLASLAQQLVTEHVDVIAAVGTDAALAARRSTATVPIVMVGIGDPGRVGLVKNLGRPEGNITGVSLLNQDLWGKRLELFKEILPRLSRLAVLYQDTAGGRVSVQEVKVIGRRLGLELPTTIFRSREALPDYFAQIHASGAEAVAIVPSPVFDEVRSLMAELALTYRLPTLVAFPEYADAGGLMAYGPGLAAAHRRAAYYVDKILRGAKPADLPVEQPTKFELVINLKTARALGLTIPPSLLQRADQVIE